MLREEENICCQEIVVVKNKIKKLSQLSSWKNPLFVYTLVSSLSECVGFVDCMAAIQTAILFM